MQARRKPEGARACGSLSLLLASASRLRVMPDGTRADSSGTLELVALRTGVVDEKRAIRRIVVVPVLVEGHRVVDVVVPADHAELVLDQVVPLPFESGV